MEGAGDGVLVALHHVVLGAQLRVVGGAVEVAPPRHSSWHVHEVGRGVAVAGHVAQVQCIRELPVVELQMNLRAD